MIGFKKLAHKITNVVLALFIISAQLFAPIGALVPKAIAAASADIDQCRNGALSSPVSCGSGWDNGNLNGSQSHYRENDSVPFRFKFGDLTIGPTHTITFEWDTTKGGKHAYDYLTTYNRTEVTANPCTGIAGCGSPSTFPIPVDTNVTSGGVTPMPGNFTMFNGTILSASAYTLTGTYAGDSATRITLTFTATNATPVLAWGGHVASQIDWGFGNSASSISGSPYHMRLVALNGSGGNQDRSIQAAAILPTPTITTQASNSSVTVGQTVTDLATFVGPSQNSPVVTGNVKFFICGPNTTTNPSCTTGGSQVGGIMPIANGQATSAGYTVTSAGNYCFRAEYTPLSDSPYSPQNHTNLTSECFSAAPAPSSITIIKDAVPDDSQDFAFTASGNGTNNFTLDDDGNATLPNSQTFNGLATGTYTFTEASVDGWYLDSIECPNITETKDLTAGTVSLTITAGQNITCTFTNRKLGQIIVTKQTNPNGDPQAFSITATGTNTISGDATRDIIDNESETFFVRHGEYDVSEQDLVGWAEDVSACQNLVVDGNAPLVNGVPTRTCTITNTKLATLQIIKNALPDHEQDFAFTTTGLGGSIFSLDDDTDGTLSNQNTFANLTPGQQYSVTEQSSPGWSLTDLTCNNVAQLGSTATVTPTAGQTITCTFTNTKLISVSGTKFEVNAGTINGGLGTVLGGWTIFIDSNNNGTLDHDELSDETDQNGNYSFENLLYGTTVVLREVLQSGWTQIFGPNSFTLDSADDITDQDFGNFKNSSISGFKWDDQNANDVVDQDEEKLNGWTVTLYNDGNDVDTDLDDELANAVTTGAGAYSFTDLTPGTYAVCETQQAGWIQTYPNGNGCHTIIINESGETNEANFGNQGRGTIAVVKNVDTDGDGTIDSQDVTNWTWDIDNSGNFATGSGNSQGVAAGTYTINEDQQANYHVTASSCSGETTPQNASTSLSVTVAPGENVVCTFTNTRDTGNLTVNKVVNPTTDNGLFNLQINGQIAGTGANVGNGGTTGSVQVVTGSYTIGETAGTNTNLNDYTSSYSCVNQNQVIVANGNSTTSTSFAVNSTDNFVCTITNTRLGNIILQKETNPNGSSESFEFDTSYDITNFFLSDGQSNDSGNLLPGSYSVTEIEEAGWELDSATCSDQSEPSNIELSAGETVTCTFTNEQDANIVVIKQTNPDGDPQSFSFNASYDRDGFNLSDGQQNDSGDLDPGTYSVSENELAGWDLESATCSDESTPGSINLSAGETVTCTFTNEKDAHIIVVKQTDPGESEELFDFTASYDTDGFNLSDGQQNDSGDLDPGTYSVSETAENGWDLDSIVCSDGSVASDINLIAGETVTCTFINIQRSNITVVKDADPNDEQDFHFTIDEVSVPVLEIERLALLDILSEFSLDDDNDPTLLNSEITNVRPGTYKITEDETDGWDLTDIDCGDIQIFSTDENSITFYIEAGVNITCTFTNVKRAQVVVTKYNDVNQNGMQDVTEETLSNWEMTLNDAKQVTGQDGSTTFTNLLPNEEYVVSETQQEGWNFSGISCSGNLGHAAVSSRESSNATVIPAPGETVSCKIGNVKPTPAVLGDSTTVLAAAKLVNTGQENIWIGTAIGLSLMTFALATLALPIKTKKYSSVISISRLSR